jgi:DNA-directed RNA polymerase specialized sigma24 family protein
LSLSGPSSRGKREIQAEDFRRLLARLDADPVRAAEAYESLREQLVKFFIRRQSSQEAEELADKALDEVAKKPDSYEIRNVHQFVIGIARYLQMERSRRKAAHIQLIDNESLAGAEPSPEMATLERIDHLRRVKCFVTCMEALKPEERWLVLEYYPADGQDLEGRRRRLTQLLGIDAGALTTRMNRLRSKLVKCCDSCYKPRRDVPK